MTHLESSNFRRRGRKARIPASQPSAKPWFPLHGFGCGWEKIRKGALVVRLLGAALGLLIPALAMAADDALLRELENRSPFLPSDYQKNRSAPSVAPQPPGEPLERLYRFTGVFEMGGKQRFALHDLRQNRGFWVEMGEGGSTARVTRFDSDNTRVFVTVDGRAGWLPLQKRDREVTQPPLPGSGPAATSRDKNKPESDEDTQNQLPLRRRVIIAPKS